MQSNNLFNYFSPSKTTGSDNKKRAGDADSPSSVKRRRVDDDDDDGTPSPQKTTSSYFAKSKATTTTTTTTNKKRPAPTTTTTTNNNNNLDAEVDGITADMLEDMDDFVLPSSNRQTDNSNNNNSNNNNNNTTPNNPYKNQAKSTSNSIVNSRSSSSPFSKSMSSQSSPFKAQPPSASRKPPSSSSSSSSSQKSSRSLSSSSGSQPEDTGTPPRAKFEGGSQRGSKEEARFSFLVDVRDENGNPPESPDYDPTTLKIPNLEYLKLTAFERQYWDVKRKFFDTVIFFKKGKFYELYENDADIANRLLDLKMTDRVNMRMAGVPEVKFSHWAGKLLQLGYKVGKVDELETGIGKAKRQNEERGRKTKEVVIRRELSCILTAGTLSDPSLLPDHTAHYLLALKEDDTQYGFVLLDAAGGVINLGQFEDDPRLSTLETLLLQTSPKEVLYEKGSALSPLALGIIKRTLAKPLLHAYDKTVFCEPHETLKNLANGGYYKDGDFPESLTSALRKLGGAAEADGCPLALSALGACVWYLQTLKLDRGLLTLGNFRVYDVHGGKDDDSALILDGTAIQNLEILANSTDGGVKGSLLALLNRCVTPFGKRLFRTWVLRPLRDIPAIEDRLDAVDDLIRLPGFLEGLTKRISVLPDMERLVARVHVHSCRLIDVLNLLQALEAVQALAYQEFTEEMRGECKSQQLKTLEFPDLTDVLEEMHSYFSWDDARTTGKILPEKGFLPEYDEILASIDKIKKKLNSHLAEQCALLKCTVQYQDVGKERYQIEVPVAKSKSVPSNYTLMSQKQNVRRYHTPTIKSLLQPLAEAEDTALVLLRDVLLKLQQKLDVHYEKCMKAAMCVAHLDALMSLAKASSQSATMCRPIFVNSPNPVLKIKNGRHPCMIPPAGGDIIPNDLLLGSYQAENGETEEKPPVMLLTGPNMGGKSTLLRQACLTVIMAQLGCYVPADECTLTPADRVFTRLGARDDIVAGQSTFMVELQETSNVLKYATVRSLVILDELGRGTSTFDGFAIAYSVLMHLASKVKCRTLFSTHYHTLTEEVGHMAGVGVSHMASVVDDEKREVTFLYRVTPGTCPRSYGLHVASMAGLPKSIVEEAEGMANKLHISLISRLAMRISVAERKNDVEVLMILWRAAKGRKAAWGNEGK